MVASQQATLCIKQHSHLLWAQQPNLEKHLDIIYHSCHDSQQLQDTLANDLSSIANWLKTKPPPNECHQDKTAVVSQEK